MTPGRCNGATHSSLPRVREPGTFVSSNCVVWDLRSAPLIAPERKSPNSGRITRAGGTVDWLMETSSPEEMALLIQAWVTPLTFPKLAVSSLKQPLGDQRFA